MHPDDEALARRLSGQIQVAVLAAIERCQREHLDEGVKFNKYIVLHALTEILGREILETIEADPDRARRWCRETIATLDLFVSASEQRPQ